VTATAVTRAAAQAARARAGTAFAAGASRTSTAIPASLGQETTRHTTNLNAAWPARNRAGPPRIIHADAVLAVAPGAERTFSSAAAATMMPATITGWMKWYAERPRRPGSSERAILRAAASALWSKYSHHSATEPANATAKPVTSAAVTDLSADSVAPMITTDSPSAIRMKA
jgi:hypothetical protein